MKIIQNTLDFQLHMDTAVTIGKFDGIHKGHQLLLEKLSDMKRKGLATALFTFDPSPAEYFSGKKLLEITTKAEKYRFFEKMGIDVLVEYPMTRENAAIPAEVFLQDILVGQMQMKYLVAGEDVSFGDGGKGNAGLLRERSSQLGYTVEILPKICDQKGNEISSTLLRGAILKGDMEHVRELIGRGFVFTGEVVHGRHLGTSLGMPTANLLPDAKKLLPPFGVYYSKTTIAKKTYNSITNIGCKPTVNEKKEVGLETYIYDFSQGIYGEKVEVELVEFKRPEMKFESVDDLKKQMKIDLSEGKERCF